MQFYGHQQPEADQLNGHELHIKRVEYTTDLRSHKSPESEQYLH
jgi:hypothetical protein